MFSCVGGGGCKYFLCSVSETGCMSTGTSIVGDSVKRQKSTYLLIMLMNSSSGNFRTVIRIRYPYLWIKIPDPRIRTIKLRLRTRILPSSSVAFKIKNENFPLIFCLLPYLPLDSSFWNCILFCAYILVFLCCQECVVAHLDSKSRVAVQGQLDLEVGTGCNAWNINNYRRPPLFGPTAHPSKLLAKALRYGICHT